MTKRNVPTPPPVPLRRRFYQDWPLMVSGVVAGLSVAILFACVWVVAVGPAPVAVPHVDAASKSASVNESDVGDRMRKSAKEYDHQHSLSDDDSNPRQPTIRVATKQIEDINKATTETASISDHTAEIAIPIKTHEPTDVEAEKMAVAEEDEKVTEQNETVVEVVNVEEPNEGDADATLSFPTSKAGLAWTDDRDDSTEPRVARMPKRLKRMRESQLRGALQLASKEFDILSMGQTTKELASAIQREQQLHKKLGKRANQGYLRAELNQFHPILELAKSDRRLAQLPLRDMGQCNIDKRFIPPMTQMSTGVRAAQSRAVRTPTAANPLNGNKAANTTYAFASFLAAKPDWHKEEAIPGLIQMLQTEDRVIRLELIRILSSVEGIDSSKALANRALFDFWSAARDTAVESLESRPRYEYRQELLDGLRYPWSPVSEHAAQALVSLDDQQAVGHLVEMLQEPDPSAPYQDDEGQWNVDELVRVNHMRNCTLCHAPSFVSTDPIRGLVPTPGQALPVVYYQSQSGNFVRADVTYIKQDFSAMQEVKNASPWPSTQRFDFFKRTRQISASEARGLDRSDAMASSYPQREAVLYALRNLTGDDVGNSSSAWRQYYDKHYRLN